MRDFRIVEHLDHLVRDLELNEIGIGADENFFQLSLFDLCGYRFDCARAVIACFVEYKSVHNISFPAFQNGSKKLNYYYFVFTMFARGRRSKSGRQQATRLRARTSLYATASRGARSRHDAAYSPSGRKTSRTIYQHGSPSYFNYSLSESAGVLSSVFPSCSVVGSSVCTASGA